MDIHIESSWKSLLQGEFEQPYFIELMNFVNHERNHHVIHPRKADSFRAFNACSFEKVKVVILGQDPYHGTNQANGLCFSVNDTAKIPPSLHNIFKEIQSDIGTNFPESGNLAHWASQGVLLLNATLSVRAGEAGSHQKKGWEDFTDSVIQVISDQKQNIVFMLWGAYAQKKGAIIDHTKHLVLRSPHPSPLSAHRGFFGSKHFSKANLYLKRKGNKEIMW